MAPSSTTNPTTALPTTPDVVTVPPTAHGKDGYGYTSFIDPGVTPSTIDYNHGAVSEISENVS